ncbi:uncharacterized protein LOC132728447 [Ruditapes philippinarum]|uniref:uncharacterized protein LOC132728447 n=1 Tax=Ruditapes philippinarum TaxID=129788 RepID=UPI00295C2C5D|nr:uncharacterized protein LOC132728447 [Ruditapes philippinarum]
MSTEGLLADTFKQVQAINLDYPNTNYDRGHLNPSFYQCDERRTATFTLTNAVPQDPCFNQQIWKQMEDVSKDIMSEKCNFPGARRFFVTGAVPSNNKIPAYQQDEQEDKSRDINRVSIPSIMWTAACCDSTNSVYDDDRDKGFSFGYYGDNVPDSYVIPYLVTQLEEELANQYGVSKINIFDDSCFSSSENSEDAVQKLNVPVERRIMKTIADMSESSKFLNDPDKKSFLDNFNSESQFNNNFNNQNWGLHDVDVGLRDTRDNVQYTRARLAPYGMVPLLMYPNSHAVSKRSVDGSVTHNEDEYIIVPSRESSLSAGGSRCRDDHPCGYHKESYQWCYTDWSNNWDYCCIDDCGLRDSTSYSWCYTSNSKHWSYCSQRSSMIGVEGKRCRADHECGLHGKFYHWCYTDTVDNWQYCCQPWHTCDKHNRSYKWCYVGFEKETEEKFCNY